MTATSLPDIAVIPAKARSTRFPGKNVAPLAGRPLVVHSIEAARNSGLFDTVMVSTDDAGIAATARRAGAEVPFLRDSSLTQDGVEVPAVVRSAVEWFRVHRSREFGWVCILQPTCPLRSAQDIITSRRRADEVPAADAVVSVSAYHHHPGWALRIEDGRLVPESAQWAASRQDLPELYHPDGVIYWRRASALLALGDLYSGIVIPYFTPRNSAVDIDYPEDLLYAEWLMSQSAQPERIPVI